MFQFVRVFQFQSVCRMEPPKARAVQRCRWLPSVEKTGKEDFRLVLKCKDSRGSIVRFSTAPKSVLVKPPWGPPDSCSTGFDDKFGNSEIFFR